MAIALDQNGEMNTVPREKKTSVKNRRFPLLQFSLQLISVLYNMDRIMPRRWFAFLSHQAISCKYSTADGRAQRPAGLQMLLGQERMPYLPIAEGTAVYTRGLHPPRAARSAGRNQP